LSTKYKFHEPDGVYFISFATVGWADVFTRVEYKDIFVESVRHCQHNKGLELFAWCLMTNHVHLIARATGTEPMAHIMRDLKKDTSKQIIKAISENPNESRREWLMSMFRHAGENNPNNTTYQFWRQDNHPIELFTAEVLWQKLNYLHQNPVKEGIVEHPEEYLYSSVRNYADRPGLLNITPIDPNA
jgi:REP element-mobilizing transposase RayT